MDFIDFKYVIPQVFASREQQDSDIWQQVVRFQKGQLYLIEAESGKGKSTFCSYIQGYRSDYTGKILFDDVDTRTFKVRQWTDVRMRQVSHLFQELRLFGELTALENVEIKNRLTGFKSREQIVQWFEMLGIADKMNTKAALMSFGQQQRVALMRALVQPFDFLLADEPISHLDDTNSRIMAEIMMDEARAQGAGVIITSIGKHMELNYDKAFRL
ncbi:MAG: ATP-binding cassette domain-containing protein [Prevotella sp.]|nr:ATP-binding cassette domain-containing protein [Prevotella sp.]